MLEEIPLSIEREIMFLFGNLKEIPINDFGIIKEDCLFLK